MFLKNLFSPRIYKPEIAVQLFYVFPCLKPSEFERKIIPRQEKLPWNESTENSNQCRPSLMTK